ncbi:MAG: ABC transporter ATP-binding protein [Nitrospiria bacterium]
MEVIKTEGLRKEFTTGLMRKKTVAVESLNLCVEEGELFGFLGPNGAGKTTTIKMLLGLIYPTAGNAWILGKPISQVKMRNDIGFLPEQPYFYDYLTAEEFLKFYGGLFEINQSILNPKIRELLSLVGLEGKERTQLRKLSKGMLQRVGIAQALINDPRLIILDEPMSGLDPIGRKEIRDIILHLREKGKTVFFSSHILSDVEMICDRVGIIGNGRLLKTGKVDHLIHSMGTKSIEMSIEGAKEVVLNGLKTKAQKIVTNGNKSLLVFEKEEDVQNGIKEVIVNGGKIISITHQKISLEEYFVKQIGEKDHV